MACTLWGDSLHALGRQNEDKPLIFHIFFIFILRHAFSVCFSKASFARFEETACTLWGDAARFGETACTLWGDSLHALGRQSARFGETKFKITYGK
jgi:hypothetical protein